MTGIVKNNSNNRCVVGDSRCQFVTCRSRFDFTVQRLLFVGICRCRVCGSCQTEFQASTDFVQMKITHSFVCNKSFVVLGVTNSNSVGGSRTGLESLGSSFLRTLRWMRISTAKMGDSIVTSNTAHGPTRCPTGQGCPWPTVQQNHVALIQQRKRWKQ